MSINYIDTLTMFYNCSCDIRPLFTTHWIWDNREKDTDLHHFCIKTDYCFVRFFPDMYGAKRLYVTCSLPKLYHQSNRNTYNIKDYDNQTFMNILHAELGKVMNVSGLQTILSEWQPSRIDLFRMMMIDPIDRMEYHYGYSRLTYRGVQTTTYKNTNYLPSSAHSKQPCVLHRNYNKTIEEQEKRSLLFGNLPEVIENEHEALMLDMDIPDHLYRHEFALRRNYVKRFCDKYNKPLNMETIMSEQFQKRMLNDLVISRGLHYNILSKQDFRKIVPQLFKHKQSQLNALKMAEAIRNKKSIPLKPHQRYRTQHILNSYFISTATTNFVSIKALDLLL